MVLARVLGLYKQIGGETPDATATIQALLLAEDIGRHVDSVGRYLRELRERGLI
jgi:predicted transcriptional regulator